MTAEDPTARHLAHAIEPVDPPRLPAAQPAAPLIDMTEKAQQLPAAAKPVVPANPKASKRKGLTKKVRAAIEAMVHDGMKRSDAAEHAGLTDHGLRQALKKPAVLQHLRSEMDVLRESARPRALQRIAELADDSESEKVGLDAAKYLDSNGKSDQTYINLGVQVNVAPGYVIAVPTGGKEARQTAQQAGSTRNCLED
jgi:hypothetical protein